MTKPKPYEQMLPKPFYFGPPNFVEVLKVKSSLYEFSGIYKNVLVSLLNRQSLLMDLFVNREILGGGVSVKRSSLPPLWRQGRRPCRPAGHAAVATQASATPWPPWWSRTPTTTRSSLSLPHSLTCSLSLPAPRSPPLSLPSSCCLARRHSVVTGGPRVQIEARGRLRLFSLSVVVQGIERGGAGGPRCRRSSPTPTAVVAHPHVAVSPSPPLIGAAPCRSPRTSSSTASSSISSTEAR